VPGLLDGRIYSGREALATKLIDEIGGEAEAVRWLEEKRGVTKDLKVVDWKPSRDDGWGLRSAIAGFAAVLVGEGAASIGRLMARDQLLGTLGLDGLISVWHPGEN
jgi:protease-4